MIYISSDIGEKTIEIPINLTRNDTGNYKLVLFNTTTRQEYEYEVEDNQGLLSYYTFTFAPVSMPEGEYEYTLKDNDRTYARGLLRYGDYNVEVKTGGEKINDYKYQRDI